MTKADLVEQVAEKTGLTRTDVAATVDTFLDAVRHSLENGKNIEIRGFGTFKIKPRKARKARKGRNPKTGETIQIPVGRKVSFKPSFSLKKLVRLTMQTSPPPTT